MLRGRFNYPDLDVLDSPLLSPSPLTSLGGIPGSALAERIFNDPDSWDETDGDEGEFPEDVDGTEPLTWLVEEIEKFRVTSAGIESNQPPDLVGKGKMELVTTPTSALSRPVKDGSKADTGAALIGIGKRGGVRPISLAALFERSTDDFSAEIQAQLSKILDSGGIPHHVRPLSATLSSPSTSGTSATPDTPLHLHLPSAPFVPSNDHDISPVSVYSASATLSFLEWYGIYPDSPRMELSRKLTIAHRKSLRPKTPLLQIPTARQPMRPSPLLNSSAPTPLKLVLTDPFTSEPLEPLEPLEPSPREHKEGPTRTVTPPGLTRPLPQTRSASQGGGTSNESRTQPPHVIAFSRSESAASVPTTLPPPYSRTPSPERSLPRRPSDAPSLGSSSDSGGSASVRRLPSIPPETSAKLSSTPPMPHTAVGYLRRIPSRTGSPLPTPPIPSASNAPSPALTPSYFGMASMASTVQPNYPQTSHPLSQQFGYRPASSIRSPLGGPVGPRTRSGTRGSQDLGIPQMAGQPITHRPPGLRL